MPFLCLPTEEIYHGHFCISCTWNKSHILQNWEESISVISTKCKMLKICTRRLMHSAPHHSAKLEKLSFPFPAPSTCPTTSFFPQTHRKWQRGCWYRLSDCRSLRGSSPCHGRPFILLTICSCKSLRRDGHTPKTRQTRHMNTHKERGVWKRSTRN